MQASSNLLRTKIRYKTPHKQKHTFNNLDFKLDGHLLEQSDLGRKGVTKKGERRERPQQAADQGWRPRRCAPRRARAWGELPQQAGVELGEEQAAVVGQQAPRRSWPTN